MHVSLIYLNKRMKGWQMNNLYQVNDGVYQHFIEFTPSIDDCVSMLIKTKWTGAHDPDALQNKFHFILSKEDMKNLGKQLIEQASK
jgi:hypothetical protein